ncbi:hypothetical protein [Mesorhizobium sp. A623]
MAENDKQYWDKKASDDEALARLTENLKALDDTLAHHEKEREQTNRYYDKKRDAERWQQMIEQARKGDRQLSREEMQEIGSDIQRWHDGHQKALVDYIKSDGTKEIPRGTFSGFDNKAAEIVEKGNAFTTVPFLQHAQKLADERYQAFNDKQGAYDQAIADRKSEGDANGALVLEARKTYEAKAYERDTGESVLAMYGQLYGKDSKNYREQYLEVTNLGLKAEDLYAKLNAVTEMDASLRETMESDNLMLEAPPKLLEGPQVHDNARDEIVIEYPEEVDTQADVQDEAEKQADQERLQQAEEDAVDQDEASADELTEQQEAEEAKAAEIEAEQNDVETQPEQQSSMMDRLRDRVIEAKAVEEAEELARYGTEDDNGENDTDKGYPVDDVDDAEARADEMQAAWDRGEDPMAYDHDHDFEGEAQAAEDAHLRSLNGEEEADSDGEAQMREDDHFSNPQMPTEMEFGDREEDHDREYEMAPVRRSEEREQEQSAEKTETPKTDASASLYAEFSQADRHRIYDMKERSRQVMEAMDKASESGDEQALHDARGEMAASNSDFNDYLTDRREFKSNMNDFRNDADRFLKSGADTDSKDASKFEDSYKQASNSIDRMEAEGKPWAEEMRRYLHDTGLEYHQKEIETRLDKPTNGGMPEEFEMELADNDRAKDTDSGVASVMRRADDEMESDHEPIDIPAPIAAVSYQSQEDEDRMRQR